MSSISKGLGDLVGGSGINAAGGTNASEVLIGHVLDVVKDDTSPYYSTLEDIGKIRIRIIPQEFNKYEEAISNFAYPLDRSDYRLPFAGEQVMVYQALGPNVSGRPTVRLYYRDVVTQEPLIANNIQPFLGTDPYHIRKQLPITIDPEVEAIRFDKKNDLNLDVTRGKYGITKPREGDKILEGRFGGLIKFTSTINADTSQLFGKETSLDGDPLLIIKNNTKESTGPQLQDDDINEDDASIYATTTQTIPIELSCSKNMFTWNLDIITGEVQTLETPSQIYNKVIDTGLPFNEAYITPTD